MPLPFKIIRIDTGSFDPEVLATLMRHCKIEGFQMMQRLHDNFVNGSNRFDKKGEALFIADHETKIIGIGGRNIDPYTADTGIARVRHLYVMPEWRYIGVGSRLLNQIIDVPERVFKKITVRTDNPAARKFYEVHGFKYVGEGEVTHKMDL